MPLDIKRIERTILEAKTTLKLLEKILSKPLNEYLDDEISIYAARYAIIKIVEALAVIGTHILETNYNYTPETYSEVFELLGKLKIVSPATANSMKKLAGLRNLLVHRYWEIDDERIYREAKTSGLKAIKKFLEEVEEYVSRNR